MHEKRFVFSEGQFENFFPFYIALDEKLAITSLGKSLKKIFPSVVPGMQFQEAFLIKRPFVAEINPSEINRNSNVLTLLEAIDYPGVTVRGQFEETEWGFIFVGSPWFVSTDEIKKQNLNLSDFAHYDPMLDLLELLRSRDLTTQRYKELLAINNKQHTQLERDKEELNKLSVVASANENGVVFTHPTGEIFWCNDAYIRLTGYSREEILGKTPIEIGRAQNTDKEALIEMVERFSAGELFDIEITHARKDGSYFWTRTKGQPIYDAEGKVVQYFAMIEDKTLEKEQEEQLLLLSVITQKNVNGIIICDKDGYTEWVNPSFSRITGYEFREVVGKKPGELLQGPETDKDTVKYLSEQIKLGLPFYSEILNYKKNGDKLWLRLRGQALHNKWGELSRYFAIEEDITREKRLQEQTEELLESLEKSNAELENYAQIVSHDLKSPLRSINSLVAWIKEENEGNLSEQTSGYLGMIEDKLEKMDNLIQGILTYSKITSTEERREKVDVHEVVKGIVSIIHIPENTVVNITCQLPVIEADSYRIHQLFQNLISNAVNYIDKPEGLVEVGVTSDSTSHTFFIKDNGPGIARENHEKIFKIFQSLAKSDKATGVGLSIVRKIVETYNGRIWVESELKQGTTFFICLPK